MKHYINIDGIYQGIFNDEKLVEQLNLTEVPTPPTEGLVKPRWINNEWVETATPEEIEAFQQSQKNQKIQELNQQQDAELQPTDFYVIRANDPTDGRAIPQEVIELRKSIRDKFDIMKKAILILFFTLFSYSQEFGQISVSIDPTATIKESSPNLVAELELVSNWGYVKATTQILPAIEYFDIGAGA